MEYTFVHAKCRLHPLMKMSINFRESNLRATLRLRIENKRLSGNQTRVDHCPLRMDFVPTARAMIQINTTRSLGAQWAGKWGAVETNRRTDLKLYTFGEQESIGVRFFFHSTSFVLLSVLHPYGFFPSPEFLSSVLLFGRQK